MASKWINQKLFSGYVEEKSKEIEPKTNQLRRSDFVWASPQKGTSEKAKIYEGRFLPDQKGKFTKKYMYHMFKSGEKWVFYLCPKTHGMETFCPLCSVVSALYSGTSDDKKMASRMKRKERHVGNFYIIDDPRDKDQDDETKKVNGKVKLYEFPSKLESKLKNEILDKKEGLGFAIFDPGAEGHNIIIKIKSTKQDAKGDSYPDYADSIFSRNPSALAETDADIKKIMASTFAIDEYIASMEISKDDTIKMLKAEMLWDIVENEWLRHNGTPIEKQTSNVVTTPITIEEDVPDSVDGELEEVVNDNDLTDDDLMQELRKMR